MLSFVNEHETMNLTCLLIRRYFVACEGFSLDETLLQPISPPPSEAAASAAVERAHLERKLRRVESNESVTSLLLL